jgi:hypothetical protein
MARAAPTGETAWRCAPDGTPPTTEGRSGRAGHNLWRSGGDQRQSARGSAAPPVHTALPDLRAGPAETPKFLPAAAPLVWPYRACLSLPASRRRGPSHDRPRGGWATASPPSAVATPATPSVVSDARLAPADARHAVRPCPLAPLARSRRTSLRRGGPPRQRVALPSPASPGSQRLALRRRQTLLPSDSRVTGANRRATRRATVPSGATRAKRAGDIERAGPPKQRVSSPSARKPWSQPPAPARATALLPSKSLATGANRRAPRRAAVPVGATRAKRAGESEDDRVTPVARDPLPSAGSPGNQHLALHRRQALLPSDL